MGWEVEYGTGTNQRWYWRLINRDDFSQPWIAAEGGGGSGHATMQDCWTEIQMAKQKMLPAPPKNLGAYFNTQ